MNKVWNFVQRSHTVFLSYRNNISTTNWISISDFPSNIYFWSAFIRDFPQTVLTVYIYIYIYCVVWSNFNCVFNLYSFWDYLFLFCKSTGLIDYSEQLKLWWVWWNKCINKSHKFNLCYKNKSTNNIGWEWRAGSNQRSNFFFEWIENGKIKRQFCCYDWCYCGVFSFNAMQFAHALFRMHIEYQQMREYIHERQYD